MSSGSESIKLILVNFVYFFSNLKMGRTIFVRGTQQHVLQCDENERVADIKVKIVFYCKIG